MIFLKEKLGPVLYQLPPSLTIDTELLKEFLKHLPKNLRHTFEFRNESWYNEEVYSILEKNNCAFCIYELGGHQSPEKVTADFVYIRLHGPGKKYQGSYSEESLKQWGLKCKGWLENNKDVYIYFDNDQNGYAAFNALHLKEFIKKAL